MNLRRSVTKIAATLVLAAAVGRATPVAGTAPIAAISGADVPVAALADEGPAETTADTRPQADVAETGRLDADMPVDVALAVSRQRFSGTSSAEIAVIARDDDFADALAGSALTKTGPMLFSPAAGLPESVRTELGRVLVPGATVYLLGGEAALSDRVAQQVIEAGLTPVRLAGSSRVETALAVAGEIRRVSGRPLRAVYLARGWGEGTSAWVDAIAVGPRAARFGTPVLVTPSHRLPDSVGRFIAAAAKDEPSLSVTLLGGESALAAAVQAAVPARTHRIAGEDRAATAAALAHSMRVSDYNGYELRQASAHLVINGWHERGWAHGLAAAGLGADRDWTVVMVRPDRIPTATSEAIHGCERPGRPLVLVGSNSVIPTVVADQATGLAKGDCSLLPLRGAPQDHAFLMTRRDGTPIRFNPCAPIHYVVNTRLAPPNGLQDVHEAFRQVSEATGMTFVYDGTTDEQYSWPRAPYQPERYGKRWAPMLISWATGAEVPEFNGYAAGIGGLSPVDGVAVTAEAVFDAGQDLEPGYGTGANWGELILHEVGHAVGLHHVDAPGQIMSSGGDHWYQVGVSRYEAGDREGLRRLGRDAGCVSAPAPRPINYRY